MSSSLIAVVYDWMGTRVIREALYGLLRMAFVTRLWGFVKATERGQQLQALICGYRAESSDGTYPQASCVSACP